VAVVHVLSVVSTADLAIVGVVGARVFGMENGPIVAVAVLIALLWSNPV